MLIYLSTVVRSLWVIVPVVAVVVSGVVVIGGVVVVAGALNGNAKGCANVVRFV